ncbi:hypothetical protein [Streptomyces flaveus]|jgi:hypothetical protein|uniref:hypothetical protein n=1 Tax=Streptomyces flaveus TaxID=66370 RepID=UPI003333C816
MKHSVVTRLKAGASAVALLVSGLGLGLATAGPASAATCYGGAVKFTKLIDNRYSEMYTTSSACRDINLKLVYPATSVQVRVCFFTAAGNLNYCQSHYRTANADIWRAVAVDVKDNVKYRYQFESNSSVTAYTAD